MCVSAGVGEGERVGRTREEWYARPHYERVAALADGWREELGIDDFTARILREGIRDPPQNPEWGKGEMPVIPQTQEEKEFGNEAVEKGLRNDSRAWEEITREQVTLLKKEGYGVASSFVHWEGVDEDGKKKGRFVQNLTDLTEWWEGKSVRMEKPAEFAAQVEEGDRFISFDVKSGYHHFFLHPSIRNFFLFHWEGRYFRCIALPFAWCRAAFWFVNLMKPFVGRMRKWGYRILEYIDDFLVAPSVGRVATADDCLQASSRIDWLMGELGLARHPTKGVREEGNTRLEHLGFVWDSMRMKFTITEKKQEKVRAHARSLLNEMARGRGWVSRDSLRSFAGVATALHLALPLALFYTRSLHNVIVDYSEARKPASRAGKRVRMSKSGKKDLKEWRKIGEGGRRFVEEEPQWALHTDAAELGWGGTGGPDEGAGAEGVRKSSGVWTGEDRKQSITLRELRAVALVLGRGLGVDVQHEDVRRVRLWIDNLGAKFVIQKMSSRSPALMKELRVLHRLVTKLGISLVPQWLPSAANFFADRESRSWDPGDLKIRSKVRRALLSSYAHVGVSADGAWAYRPLGVHPVAMRKVTLAALLEDWGPERARLFCPPVDLISATVTKMRREKARGVLLVPDWGGAPWMAQVMALSTRSWIWTAGQGREVWTGRRSIEEKWRLRVVEVGI